VRQRKELLQEILIDDESILENTVEKTKQVFKVDKTGNVVFLVPRTKLTHRQEIAMVLLARYFASELDITDSDIMTAEQLAEIVEPDKASVAARLNELKKERVVESPGRGQFRISILGVEKILDEILTDG
jgi:hypothetical protein